LDLNRISLAVIQLVIYKFNRRHHFESIQRSKNPDKPKPTTRGTDETFMKLMTERQAVSSNCLAFRLNKLTNISFAPSPSKKNASSQT